MSYTAKSLCPQGYVPTTQTLAYTSPAASVGGKGTWIDSAAAANPSGASATILVHIVPSGGSPGAGNQALPAQTITAGQAVALATLAGRYLAPGDMIYWQAGTASAITAAISGREIT